ncbi:SDR family NAD(P)-dependent oxidoreductase [Allorhizobium sp. BGMRC 0089]|uniref:SDR family NAD(P)-dependent oxidoreductase n=1 Tax=Allorhizobium sonneratiae TaxID=2934936 RepID=UPI0020332D99|nr:SDR family NAD(P)-dependent oxidoreductase [Allorhizobium sonneratiae]MCM2293986.1 SDR family NAD(P)-dependent oxidoreductase [Allorhizobium sonneratiae]
MSRGGQKRTGAGALGFVEWFRKGDHARAEETLAELKRSGASALRTHLSWADYLTPDGEAWFDWLMPKLGADFDVLPCVHYTPPSLSRTGRASGAPLVLKDYADFIDHILTRYGHHFSHIELWNEPNNLLDWDWRADKDFSLFCEMVGGAAYWAKRRGFSPVLGGPCPFDPFWLNLMGERGVLDVVDVVGFHGFPGTWDSEEASWNGFDMHLGEMRMVLDRFNPKAEIWITETGYSTWRNDEMEQVRRFVQAMDQSVERLYWYSWRDVPPDVPVQEGLWFDPRHYHLGAARHDGQPKLLGRLLAEGGVKRVRALCGLAAPHLQRASAPIAITGGSGFIGANLAESFLAEGKDVRIIDNLARPGVDANLAWLKARHGKRVEAVLTDIRDRRMMEDVLADAGAVFHLAAQTAVTTSLADPREDFDINLTGTFNVLQAVHKAGRRTPVIFASTNKVYGALEDIALVEAKTRYVPEDEEIRKHGVGEDRPLDFCTPYGCSKGAADQYVLDHASTFGIPTAVLRMSCIYGPHQLGTEDQGWVAHFLIRALSGEGLTVYGNGKQVRDILHVRDAVSAYRQVLGSIDRVAGTVFNLGGGPANSVSILDVIGEIETITGEAVPIRFNDWRAGDQLYFVARTDRLKSTLGWHPTVAWQAGLRHLADWLVMHRFKANQSLPLPQRVSA